MTTIERSGGLAILHLEGELDGYTCPQVREELEGVRASGIHRVVLDLWRVRYLSSCALGLVMECSRILAKEGGGLVVAHPSPFCRRILERIGLGRMVPVFDTGDEAVAYLGALGN